MPTPTHPPTPSTPPPSPPPGPGPGRAHPTIRTVDAATLKAARPAGYTTSLPPTRPAAPVVDDDLLDVKAVAARIKASPMTVYRLVYAKQLTAVPIGLGTKRPRIRIPRSDVDRFVREGVS